LIEFIEYSLPGLFRLSLVFIFEISQLAGEQTIYVVFVVQKVRCDEQDSHELLQSFCAISDRAEGMIEICWVFFSLGFWLDKAQTLH